MDEVLEKPNQSSPRPDEDLNEDVAEEGDEDGGPDWSRFPTNLVRPVIPKRGEKEFEPTTSGGSALQKHTLDRSRAAMFSALSVERTSTVKNLSYAIWLPELARAHVTHARGVHFSSMGHSVPRPSPEPPHKLQKRLELLPEETLYLIERGSLFCWKAEAVEQAQPEGMDGTPMTVQHAFSEMIGREDLTLEKYQVYAYLRRLGYQLMRTQPPTSDYPLADSPLKLAPSTAPKIRSWLSPVFATLSRLFSSSIGYLVTPKRDWWKSVVLRPWLARSMTYISIFSSLRFIPAGHSAPLYIPPPGPMSPYEIFYNLYKPSTAFKKTQPPPPDFCIVVVNARTTLMPSLAELTAVYTELPVTAVPGPRQRKPANAASARRSPSERPGGLQPKPERNDAAPAPRTSFVRRLLGWASAAVSRSDKTEASTGRPRSLNAFVGLKMGRKNVILAVVDAGMISFFRFGQGVFEEWPMV